MNDFDLDAKLKSIRLPERPDDYWENFPSQMRWQLRRVGPSQEFSENYLPTFVWKFGFSFAVLILSLLALNQPLKAASGAIFKNEKNIRQQLAELPGHLRVLMADEHGLHYLIAEKE